MTRLIAFIVMLFFAFGAQAADSLARVETYLSKLKTMTADFAQLDPNGQKSNGKFQLKRPLKMRWQYNPPTPILMVTRGNFLTYYDYELNQVSDVPMDDTLLSILTRQKIDFRNSNLSVVENFEENGYITVTLEEKNNPQEGSLTMVFRANPMQLQHLIVKDTTQQVTQITLSNIKEGIELADNVFEFKDPRIGGRRKKSKD